MASGREVKTKIKSVKNTQKVTRALQMVSAAKIRRAQERMQAKRPYVRAIRDIISHLSQANMDITTSFLARRTEVKRVGYIVVSSDRGLAGGLNNVLFRQLLRKIQEWQSQGVAVDLVTIGQKAIQFFRRVDVNIIGSQSHLGDMPSLEQLIGSVKILLDAYVEHTIDHVAVAHNTFINTMVQKPVFDQLLPLPQGEEPISGHTWDYFYEPNAEILVEGLVTRYIESIVHQAVLENVACEHAARMVAMKAATDNASKLIDHLQLLYNKARQAAITQEISEIVGGAAAV